MTMSKTTILMQLTHIIKNNHCTCSYYKNLQYPFVVEQITQAHHLISNLNTKHKEEKWMNL